MRINSIHSHLHGFEWIQYHQKKLWTEIEEIINSIKIASTENIEFLGWHDLTHQFNSSFKKLNWEKEEIGFWTTDDYKIISKILYLKETDQKRLIEDYGKSSIKSILKTDFVKNRIAVEVQFGKYSFIAYDLFVKHLAFYIGNTIEVGIEILPMKKMQTEMSSGPGYYEGALYDLARQGKGVPAVPLVLIGIEP